MEASIVKGYDGLTPGEKTRITAEERKTEELKQLLENGKHSMAH
jgi:hypothetical protein